MKRLISVIMPVKNGRNYIQEALDGIKKQNIDLEIIIVDDASTDNTVEIAQRNGCLIIKHEKTLGQVEGKNTGLKSANGEYIMFHDHDDVLTENALSRMIEEFEIDENVMAVMAKAKDFISHDSINQNQVIRKEPYWGCLGGCILFKKDVFDKIGLFDTSIKAGEVISLTMKMKESNLNIKKIDFVSSNRRIHDTNYGKVNKKNEFSDYASILRNKLRK